jgi:hypothetical protein
MRHPYICLGGLVGVAVAMGPWSFARADRPGRSVAGAPAATASATSATSATSDRPAVSTLRLSESQVMARFIPEVRNRRDLRDRALGLWRIHFAREADAIRQRFAEEEDWRPAFADAANLVDDFLEASLLPRAGEFPAGDGDVWVESVDPSSGHRVRARKPPRRRPTLIAPADRKEGAVEKRRPAKPDAVKGRRPARR